MLKDEPLTSILAAYLDNPTFRTDLS
jgi:hypothetical protein